MEEARLCNSPLITRSTRLQCFFSGVNTPEFSIIPCRLCTLENDHVRFLSVEISFNLFYLENISSTEEIN